MSVTTAPAATVTDAPVRTFSRAKTRGLAVVGAGAAALAGWTVGALLGADYWITDVQGTARVDIPAAVGTTITTVLLAWALLAVLERVASWGRVAWTYLAVGVLAVSMTPIGLVEATASTRIGLMIAHLAVAAVVIPAFTPPLTLVPTTWEVTVRILVTQFMSLDGVTQAPGGPTEDTDGGFAHGGWSAPYFDPDTMGPTWDRALRDADAMLFGRRTWEVSAAAWAPQAGDPFADLLNAMPKYVASRTLTEADMTWEHSTLLPADDAIGAVRDLREREEGTLLVQGSASVAEQLADADLVDEYRLMIEPIMLGGGKGVFPTSGTARPLELVSVEQAATGVLIATYRVVR